MFGFIFIGCGIWPASPRSWKRRPGTTQESENQKVNGVSDSADLAIVIDIGRIQAIRFRPPQELIRQQINGIGDEFIGLEIGVDIAAEELRRRGRAHADGDSETIIV